MDLNYYKITQSEVNKCQNRSLLYTFKNNKELAEATNKKEKDVEIYLNNFYSIFFSHAHAYINEYIESDFKTIINCFNNNNEIKVKLNELDEFYYLAQTNNKYKDMEFYNLGHFLDYAYNYDSKIIYKEDKFSYFSTMEHNFNFSINEVITKLFNYSIEQTNLLSNIPEISDFLNYSIFEYEIKQLIINKKIGIKKQKEKIQNF